MMAFFQDKFKYTHHCNQQLIDLLHENPEAYTGRISILTSHTLNAHHIWNNRIVGENQLYTVWQNLDLVYLKSINDINLKNSLKLLLEKDLNLTVNYENSKGEKFRNTLGEILFHIINHSTYHRGQLMSLLKNEGIEPIITDYIFYKR